MHVAKIKYVIEIIPGKKEILRAYVECPLRVKCKECELEEICDEISGKIAKVMRGDEA